MVYLKYDFSLKIKMDFFSNLRHCVLLFVMLLGSKVVVVGNENMFVFEE